MIHRPFLVTAANQQGIGIFETNVRTCLDAARQTVHLLYQTFINHTFFRTWWYNTTYASNATSVILYVLVTGLHRGSSEDLLLDVEKTLKIFQAMDAISIARRCAKLTKEILEIARMALQKEGRPLPADQQERPSRHTPFQPVQPAVGYLPGTDYPELPPAQQQIVHPGFLIPTDGQMQWDGLTDFSNTAGNDDFFGNIMDANILDSFGASLIGFDGNFDLDFDPTGRDMGINMDES